MNVPIDKKLALVNSASSLATYGIQISVLVWVHQYLIRRMSPEEYSLMPVLNSLLLIFPLFSTILTSGISHYVS